MSRQTVLTKNLMHPCLTYDDVYMRPYEMRVSGHDRNAIVELTEHGNHFNPSLLSGVAGRVLRPTTAPAETASIENGWGESRYRFKIELVTKDPFANNIELIDVLSGYTNYSGLQNSNQNWGTVVFDPNMRLYFTNHSRMRRSVVYGPHGASVSVQHQCSQQILSGKSEYGFNAVTGQLTNNGSIHTAQPQDVFNALSASQYSAVTDLDTRRGFGSGIKLNRRQNGVSSHYMGKTLDAFTSALRSMDGVGMHEDYAMLLNDAKGHVRESSVSSIPALIPLLSEETFTRHGYITWGRMNQIFPNLDSVTQVSQGQGRIAYGQFGGRGSTDGWGGRDTASVVATILAQAVPSFMFERGITVIGMSMTNQTFDGSWAIDILEDPRVLTFTEGLDARPLVQSLLQYLRTVVLNDLLVDKSQTAQIIMTVDVMGDTELIISLDGGPRIPFKVPSFADNTFAPVLSSEHDRVLVMAQHFEELANTLSGGISLFDNPVSGVLDHNRSAAWGEIQNVPTINMVNTTAPIGNIQPAFGSVPNTPNTPNIIIK